MNFYELYHTSSTCPYELDMSTRPAQRAELKALGARYDTQRKRWYVPAGRDVAPFRR